MEKEVIKVTNKLLKNYLNRMELIQLSTKWQNMEMQLI